MWLSLPKAPCCRVQPFSHFFCYTFHSLTVPHFFSPLFLFTIRVVLAHWHENCECDPQQPAALQIETMSTRIWVLAFKHSWKGKKRLFSPVGLSHSSLVLQQINGSTALAFSLVGWPAPPNSARAEASAFSAAIFPPFWETHVARFLGPWLGWLRQSATHKHSRYTCSALD